MSLRLLLLVVRLLQVSAKVSSCWSSIDWQPRNELWALGGSREEGWRRKRQWRGYLRKRLQQKRWMPTHQWPTSHNATWYQPYGFSIHLVLSQHWKKKITHLQDKHEPSSTTALHFLSTFTAHPIGVRVHSCLLSIRLRLRLRVRAGFGCAVFGFESERIGVYRDDTMSFCEL